MIRSRDTLIVAGLYAFVSLACTQIPLLHSLGYEFSFVFALVSSLAAGVFTIRRVSFAYRHPGAAYLRHVEHVAETFRTSLLILLAVLLVPLAIMLCTMFFVKNCSPLQGIAFFLLLPGVSTVMASSLGYFCAAHYRFSKLAFFLLFAATLLYALALGYWTPAIFSYNFFYGFFPGVTYDEILPLRPALIIFRIITLIVAGGLVWMAGMIVRESAPVDSVVDKGTRLVRSLWRREHRWITLAFAIVLGAAYWFRCPLGLESTAGYIQERLGGAYRSDHFIIFYSPSSFTGSEIERVAAEHEYRLAQISNEFALVHRSMIRSYLYPSAAEKQKLMGAGATNIAKPWSGEIHLTVQSLDATLKHELVHVVAAKFGAPIIAASPSTGLTEGLAVALDGQTAARTIHQYAAGMMRFGLNVRVRDLMSLTGFAMRGSSESYILAGSFCRYLIDRYGMRKMALVYRLADFKKQYGRTIDQLEFDWRKYLTRVAVDEKDRDIIDVMFRRPTIFRKVCPRVTAERHAEAARAFAASNFALAESLYAVSYAESKSYESMSGLAASALRNGHPIPVTALLDTMLADPVPSRYLPLFLTVGDAFWMQGNTQRALELYSRVECGDLGESYAEAIGWRIPAAVASTGGAEVLRIFLRGTTDSVRLGMLDTLIAREPGNVSARYLKAKALMRLGKNDTAIALLQGLSFEKSDPHFESVRLKNIGRAFFQSENFDEARQWFWASLNYYDTEAAELEIYDWVARCEWMADHGR